MDVSILNILPYTRQKDLRPLGRPTHDAHNLQTNSLQAVQQDLLPIHTATFLKYFPFGHELVRQ